MLKLVKKKIKLSTLLGWNVQIQKIAMAMIYISVKTFPIKKWPDI